jgi:hypothetical protein
MSPDSPMDLVHIAGKKRSDTGGITRLFSEDRRQIGGEYARHRFNQRFLKLREYSNLEGIQEVCICLAPTK